MVTTQKNIFLESEGDQYYLRNKMKLTDSKTIETGDEILNFIRNNNSIPKCILEIGCSTGWRLNALSKEFKSECFGVEPSAKAIEEGRRIFNDIHFIQSIADELPFDENIFDTVIIGFCPYLCDGEDLFKIAWQIDRVLNDNGMLFILNFDSQFAYENKYSYAKQYVLI